MYEKEDQKENYMRTVHCTKIGVDCVKNNPENIRMGGPEYIGFVFMFLGEE